MLSSTLQKLLFGVAFFLAFSLCSAAEPRKPPPGVYPDHAEGTRTTVTVNVVWLPDIAAVNKVCMYLIDRKEAIVGCYDPSTTTIYAAQPMNFNDHFFLEILGHEFWHALGAEHPVLE